MRHPIVVALLLLTAACSSMPPSGSAPPPPPAPPPLPPGPPASAIGANGGTITVNQPGTPLNGFQLTMPAGMLPGPTNFAVSTSSSAGVPLGPDLVATDPVITLGSDGPALTSDDFTLRLPTTLPPNANAVVLVVDSVDGVVGVLTVVSRDSASVTVLSRALDRSVVQRPGAASVSGRFFQPSRPAPRSPVPFAVQLTPPFTPNQIRLLTASMKNNVVLPPLGVLLPNAVGFGFTGGRDNWEFKARPTTYDVDTGPGQVLSEWWTFIPGLSPRLWQEYQQVPGIEASNPDGIMLSAGLSHDFGGVLGGTIYNQLYYEKRNPVIYHRNVALALYQTMKRLGQAQPLILTNSSGITQFKLVLVVGWSPQSQTFSIEDPDVPNVGKFLDFSGATMAPYQDPTGSGVVFDVPIFAPQALWSLIHLKLQPRFADLGPPSPTSPYASQWPVWVWTSGDIGDVFETPKEDADTLFMIEDTTRIWTVAINPPFAAAGTEYVPPGAGLQTQTIYAQGATGAWAPYPNAADGSFFLDYTQFAKPSGAPYV
ncbi:MAG: hypothetical protein ACRELE_07150, partial [Gemmatimonadales bacterium]